MQLDILYNFFIVFSFVILWLTIIVTNIMFKYCKSNGIDDNIINPMGILISVILLAFSSSSCVYSLHNIIKAFNVIR